MSSSTLLEYEKRAKEAGLSWPLPDDPDKAYGHDRIEAAAIRALAASVTSYKNTLDKGLDKAPAKDSGASTLSLPLPPICLGFDVTRGGLDARPQ